MALLNLLLTSESESEADSDFLLDDSSSEEEKNSTINIKKYVEDFVSLYSDAEFKKHFRLSRGTVVYIQSYIQDSYQQYLRESSGGRKAVSTAEALLMTIWYLANTETFRQIADRFGICQGSACRIINRVISILCDLSSHFICWPNATQMQMNASEFAKKGIRNVIGAIDCTHIEILRTSGNQEEYYNRKGYHSIILQGVVDSQKRFIDVFIGEPGSQHDARVLRKSDLYNSISNNQEMMGDFILLGDSAYPALDWLIPPFKDYGNLTDNQLHFNRIHSSTRIVVEHAFGLLKNRFRRVRKFENRNLKFIIKASIVAIILHNICITQLDDILVEETEEVEIANENVEEEL